MQETGKKEYKCRHDWVGKVIHCELSKRLKFDRADKWYMHKLESHKWMQETGKKEYESRHDWIGKMIHSELCKRKFSYDCKWYMQKLESFRVNETHIILKTFEIKKQITYKTWSRVTSQDAQTYHLVDLAVPVKKKSVEHRGDGDTNRNWSRWKDHKVHGKETG